ncbi:MAG: DUF4340 domain-containing protein [Lachnospiraceae bacterium]|nr:DUF4340 domain-containing protein [Lachnospiraceae bacterium]
MTSKNMKQLLALVVVLVACMAFYAWFSSHKDEEQKKEEEKNTVEADAILEIKKSNLKNIKYVYNKKNYEIVYNKSKKKGSLKGKEKWPINQDTISTMVDSVTSILAERTMDGTDKEEYGLDKPSKKIVVNAKEDDDTKSYTLLFGNKAPNDAGYYFMIDGEEKIYVVSKTIFDAFEYDAVGLLKVDLIDSVNSSLVYDVNISSKDFNLKAKYDGDIRAGDGTWKITKPYAKEKKGVSSIFTEYFVNYESLAYDKCVAYKPSKLSKYGLDKPAFSVDLKYYEEVTGEADSKDKEADVTYNKKTFTLLVGDGVKENYEGEELLTRYYVMEKGGDRVYTMESSTAESIMNNSAFAFVDGTINGTELMEYSSVEIETADKTYKIQKENKTVENEDGEKTIEYTYKLNDKKIKTTKGDSVSSTLYALNYSGEIGNKKIKKDKTEVTIRYNGRKDGAKDLVVKFLNYDDTSYRVNKGGEEIFLISIEDVEGLIESLKSAANK